MLSQRRGKTPKKLTTYLVSIDIDDQALTQDKALPRTTGRNPVATRIKPGSLHHSKGRGMLRSKPSSRGRGGKILRSQLIEVMPVLPVSCGGQQEQKLLAHRGNHESFSHGQINPALATSLQSQPLGLSTKRLETP